MIFCSTDRIEIRDVMLSDCELIVMWKNQDLMRKMSIGKSTIINEDNQEQDIQLSRNNKQPYYIIQLKESKKPVGYIRINWMDPEKKIAWLRFGMGDDRGKGYCKEALTILISQYFDLGVHRFDAEVYEYNDASFHLLQSIGFQHEGVRRKAHITPENQFDINVMGLLKEDF